jgi:5-formyltetrahydrofolate cyclo-ligase
VDLPERELVELRKLAKRQLRKGRRALRAALPVAARAERSRAIVERAGKLAELSRARGVGLFWPIVEKGEVDLRALDHDLRTRGVRMYYPSSRDAGGPSLALLADPSDLSDEGYGFLEPPAGSVAADPSDLDVIFVPALAVSETGHRLGYGAGFYDALLPRFRSRATMIAVAYDFDLLAELPVDEWDVPADVIVTDARVLRISDSSPK